MFFLFKDTTNIESGIGTSDEPDRLFSQELQNAIIELLGLK